MKKESELAKSFVISILSQNPTVYGLSDVYEINGGNKKMLLEHLKAIANIMNKAIEELKKDSGIK